MTLDLPLELALTTGTVSVEASIDPFNVVPDQATDSLFGLDKPLEEIPRSVSIADSELLTRYNVKTVNDVVTVAPGTFTGSYFGIPGSVFIRGDIGDNFFRGFRRVENRGNYQTPVAATDHIEIVKGPPSPIYGGGRVGGFMNFVPKTARRERKVAGEAHWQSHSDLRQLSTRRWRAGVGNAVSNRLSQSGRLCVRRIGRLAQFFKGVANRYKAWADRVRYGAFVQGAAPVRRPGIQNLGTQTSAGIA
jgi:iron complex outermembrane receptor protein